MAKVSSKAAGGGVQHLLCSTAMISILAMSGQGVMAQEQSETEPTRLDTVSVEGEQPGYKSEVSSPKFTAPLVDTPRSVTVVTEEVMDDTGATSLTEALRTVPGITMAMGEGGQPFADRPFIRGSESTSGILLDGMRDSSAQSRDIFNLEQIEVVKGASGAYAGRGAPGGSINLVTKTAKSEDFVTARALFGNASQKRATVDVNKAVNESFAVRLNAMWQDSDIPGRDEVFDERWGIAPTLTWGLDGPTRLTGSFTHYEGDAMIDYGHPLDLTTGMPVAGIDPDNFYGLLNRDFHDTELNTGFVEVEHDITDKISVRNIMRYTRSENAYIATNPDDSQGNVVNDLVYRNVKSLNAWTETFVNQTDLSAEFETGTLKHNLATGVEYSNERTKRATYSVTDSVTIPRGGCDLFGAGAASGYACTDLYNPDPDDPWTGTIGLNDPTKTTVDTFGIYVFDTVEITDQFLVNFGLRWDDFSTETSTGLSNDSDFVTYQAGLVYKPTDNGSIYISYGTSASPSGVTAGDGSENIATNNEDLEPERGKNYEIGTKWELFGDRLSVNTAIFRTEIKNQHVSVEPGRGGAQDAIGKQRVHGFELSAAGQILENWSIFAGYSYLDAEIVDAGPINADQEGNEVPNTPTNSFNLWTTYNLTNKAMIGGGTTHQSGRFGNTANTRSVDGYWRFDAMASYDVTESVGLQLNVNNFTDERYYDRVYAAHMATVAPGRSIFGSVVVRF